MICGRYAASIVSLDTPSGASRHDCRTGRSRQLTPDCTEVPRGQRVAPAPGVDVKPPTSPELGGRASARTRGARPHTNREKPLSSGVEPGRSASKGPTLDWFWRRREKLPGDGLPSATLAGLHFSVPAPDGAASTRYDLTALTRHATSDLCGDLKLRGLGAISNRTIEESPPKRSIALRMLEVASSLPV